MTKILVTGGAGYIGAHTCKALAKAGFSPVVYDNLVYGHEWAVKWGPLERGDILDAARLSEVLRIHKPSGVIHFAAFAYVGESVTDPSKYYNNNVAGSISLLDAMRKHEIGDIVFSSTCATYGIPTQIPIREECPAAPVSPYGASKMMIERVLSDYASAYGFRSISLRYFNAAGADPQGEIGEDHNPETHLIPLVLDAAMGKRPHIAVMGDDYETPDGTCIRDYIHVSDLADAHVQALKKLSSGPVRPNYNLGTGIGISVREVIATAREVTGRDIPTIAAPRRPGDPPSLVADPTLAQRDLAWKPRISQLESIINTAWQWHKTPRNS